MNHPMPTTPLPAPLTLRAVNHGDHYDIGSLFERLREAALAIQADVDQCIREHEELATAADVQMAKERGQ